MLTKEELTLKVKVISQDAWKVGTNTGLNDMLEYICRESSKLLLDHMTEVAILHNSIIEDLMDRVEELENANEDGGLQKSKRNQKASNKIPRSTEARQVSGIIL